MAHIFFDFDSTVVSVETLDILIGKNLQTEKQKEEIEQITHQGMTGEIPVFESLTKRLKIAKIHQKSIKTLAENLTQFITPELSDYIYLLRRKGHNIHIISGGFEDYILPTAQSLKIPKTHVHCNQFTYNKEGFVTGFNMQNPLCKNNGKSNVIKNLELRESIIMIGDGYTDLEVYLDKKCDHFIGFGIHQSRDIIKEKAPHFAKNISEFKHILDDILVK